MKISQFVIAFLMISLVSVVIISLVGGLEKNYTSYDVNETAFSSYDKMEELQNLSSDMNESLTNIQQGSAVDIVGGLLTSGFTVLKTTWVSFDMYTDVTSEAVDNANFGVSSSSWKATALLLGLLLFIFAMIGILVGREL